MRSGASMTVHKRASRTGQPRCRRGERGSVSTEMVLFYAPVCVLVILAVVACLRLASAASDVNSAAAAAARDASLARDPAAARANAESAAAATLADRAITCQNRTVTTDTATFAPGGQVRVSVVCQVRLADLVGLRLPGTVAVHATSTQPIESFRSWP